MGQPVPLSRILFAIIILFSVSAHGQDGGAVSLRKYHGWGRFPAGAWRLVRATKETFDQKGEVNNVTLTESRSTLTLVTANDFELNTETTIEVAGQRYVSQPQKSRRDFFGVPKTAKIKQVRETDLILNGLKTKCQIWEAVVNTNAARRVTRFHIPKSGPALIMQQNSVATGASSEQRLFEIDVKVLAVDMPHRVLANVLPCSVIRTVQQTKDKRIITLEAYSEAVPGGFVHQTMKMLDNDGRLLERQTAELVDYGRPQAAAPANNTGLRSRLQRRRIARGK